MLLHGIFLTQGSNLDLLHCRQTFYHLSHQEIVHMRATSTVPTVGSQKCAFFLSFHAFYVIMLPEMWVYLGRMEKAREREKSSHFCSKLFPGQLHRAEL